VGVALALCVFALLYPLINQGRRLVWTTEGITPLEYYSERLPDRATAARDLDLWQAWTRFNYTPIQYALMEEYDAGRRGTTFRDLPWMFVPRFVAPEKPTLDHGVRVTDLVFGHRHSSTSATNFGEAYWNGGWPLVMASSFAAGVIFLVMSVTCLWLFSRPSLLAWAVGFMGILSARLLQNFFTSGLVGTAIVFFGLALLVGIFLEIRAGARPGSGILAAFRAQ
jgi:hypothetical protein